MKDVHVGPDVPAELATICAECKFCPDAVPNADRLSLDPSFWSCAAPRRDPVSGRAYVPLLCTAVNNGRCPHYAKLLPTTKAEVLALCKEFNITDRHGKPVR